MISPFPTIPEITRLRIRSENAERLLTDHLDTHPDDGPCPVCMELVERDALAFDALLSALAGVGG